jgi:hypothetical protein
MTDDRKDRAEERLSAAVARAGIRDPRGYYRAVLRHLRDRDPEAFARATSHYEGELLSEVAAGADPVAHWLDYGRLLCRELGPGRTVEVDATGRARDAGPVEAGIGLTLFLPDDAAAPPLVLLCPAAPTPAQTATLELLVEGRLTASAYERR